MGGGSCPGVEGPQKAKGQGTQAGGRGVRTGVKRQQGTSGPRGPATSIKARQHGGRSKWAGGPACGLRGWLVPLLAEDTGRQLPWSEKQQLRLTGGLFSA